MTHPIDACITEMQGYLNAGQVGYDGLYSRNQMNFRGMVWGINEYLRTMPDTPEVVRIRQKMLALADEAQVERGVFAVNTTLYGRAPT